MEAGSDVAGAFVNSRLLFTVRVYRISLSSAMIIAQAFVDLHTEHNHLRVFENTYTYPAQDLCK